MNTTTELTDEQDKCGGCNGTGWTVRDPDIGTDQECFVCGGSGRCEDAAPAQSVQPKEAEQSQNDDGDIWPIVNIDVDESGKVTGAKLYAPGLPPGNHDVYPVRVPYIDEHTEAWLACSDTIKEFIKDYLDRGGMNGIESAISAIRELGEGWKKAREQAAPSVPEAKTFSLPNIGPILPNLQTGKVELLPLQYRQALEAYARSAVISFAKAIAAAPAAQAPVTAGEQKHSALTIWRAIGDEAEAVMNSGKKYLMLTEEMCIRLGTALESEAGPVRTKEQDTHGWTSVHDRLPIYGEGRRVVIYTEGYDFGGEQFFHIEADALIDCGEEDAPAHKSNEVAKCASHWIYAEDLAALAMRPTATSAAQAPDAKDAAILPEKIVVGVHANSKEYAEGWNDCIDEFAAMQENGNTAEGGAI